MEFGEEIERQFQNVPLSRFLDAVAYICDKVWHMHEKDIALLYV